MDEVAKFTAAILAKQKPGRSSDFTNFDIPDSAIEKVAKFCSKIKHRPKIIIRGCQVGKTEAILKKIGRALQAKGIDAPVADQLYVPIYPIQVSPEKFGELVADNNLPALTNRRLFWPLSNEDDYKIPVDNKFSAKLQHRIKDLGALYIKIEHIHLDASSDSWATHRNKSGVWGDVLNRLWYAAPVGPNANSFIAKVIWDKKDIWFSSDDNYMQMHRTVTNL